MGKNETMQDWIDALSSKAPVPGGGGAAALGGALAAALGQMVVNLTIGKKQYADVEAEIQQYRMDLEKLQEKMMDLMEEDAKVFAPLAEAYRMPKETQEQQAEKERVMEECLLGASLVPLMVMEKANEMLKIIDQLEAKGSRIAVSDAGVAAQFARTALNGAAMNVYINTRAMKNRARADELANRAKTLAEIGVRRADAVYGRVLQRLTDK